MENPITPLYRLCILCRASWHDERQRIIMWSSWWELPLSWAGTGSPKVIVFTARCWAAPRFTWLSDVWDGCWPLCYLLCPTDPPGARWEAGVSLTSSTVCTLPRVPLPRPCSFLQHSQGAFSPSLFLTAAHHPTPSCLCAAAESPALLFSGIFSQMWAAPNVRFDP